MSSRQDRYVISGGRALAGQARVSGAKNAALPILAATLLTRGECILRDVPAIRDVATMLEIFAQMGVGTAVVGESPGGQVLRIDATGLSTWEVQAELSREMRSSIFLMGPLLGRAGRVRISYPGGCAIGPRPIDFHLRGLEALGAVIRERYGYIEAEAPGGLVGREIFLDFPSVGATENLIMAAVLARGHTAIRGAAREPEIVDLQNFLNAMGARVRGAGVDVIRIEGVPALGGAEHQVIPDRIEAGTFVAAAAITGGVVEVENAIPEHMEAVLAKVREMGVAVEEPNGGPLVVKGVRRLRAVDLKTLPYPGFPTDMQPQFMALAAVAEGTSIITETIFENRFNASEELRRLGGAIRVEGRSAVVQGVPRLSGALVAVPALREGIALVLAGLVADGTTTVEGIAHIDRGYFDLEGKLVRLGATIRRVPG